MMRAAEKAGNIVQVGFQRRQSLAFKKAKELIDAGKAGKIHQIEAQINYNPVLVDNTIQTPPSSLDWDLWLGTAPKRAFNNGYIPANWRDNVDH